MKKTIEKLINSSPLEFEGIPYDVVRRKVMYARVEFKRNKLLVVVPPGFSPLRILEENKETIIKKFNRYMKHIEAAKRAPMVDWTIEQFEDIVSSYIESYSHILKVKPRCVKFRKMKRRWGSCRSDGTVTLNIFLQFVPQHLIAYIIFHELAHLIVRNHGNKFKALIATQYPNYRELDKEIAIYGLKLLS